MVSPGIHIGHRAERGHGFYVVSKPGLIDGAEFVEPWKTAHAAPVRRPVQTSAWPCLEVGGTISSGGGGKYSQNMRHG